MKVLHISNVLPSPAKDRVNDVLLVTSEKFSTYVPNSKNEFIVTIPYANLLLSLLSKKWQRYFALKKQGRYDWDSIIIEVLAIPMVRTGSSFFRYFLYYLGYHINKAKIKSIIQKEKPDVIHAHNVAECAYIAKKIFDNYRIPFVVTSRNMHNFYGDAKTQSCLQQSKAVISINYNQFNLCEKYLSIPSFLIPHGVDDRFFTTKERTFREEVTPLKLVSLCSLIPLKNIDKVLQALSNANIDFTYDIYGEGPERGRLEDLVNKLNFSEKVRLKGFIDHWDVPKMLADYEIFVMPSYPETFGRVFLEAMAAGLVVIAAKGTGIDGYLVDRNTGFLVDHNNVIDMERVFIELHDNPKLKFEVANSSKKRAFDFKWPEVIKKLENVYKLALKDKI